MCLYVLTNNQQPTTGYSTLWMASALPKEGKLITCEIDPTCAEFAARYFELFNKSREAEIIQLKCGPALHTLQELITNNTMHQTNDPIKIKPFDVIFIDADKRRNIDYYNFILEHNLLHDLGVMIIDNTLWKGKVALEQLNVCLNDKQTEVIREFNEFVATDPRTIKTILPIRDGLTLVMKSIQ
jgi:caffeoyl-CoA O-methyltransferase